MGERIQEWAIDPTHLMQRLSPRSFGTGTVRQTATGTGQNKTSDGTAASKMISNTTTTRATRATMEGRTVGLLSSADVSRLPTSQASTRCVGSTGNSSLRAVVQTRTIMDIQKLSLAL